MDKFQVGDKVKVIGTGDGLHFHPVGSIGKIVRNVCVDPRNVFVRVAGLDQCIQKADLELVAEIKRRC
jgi:hypothetical protein